MNEQELKQLWKQTETSDFPIINFEQIQKSIVSWHGKLRRKIELDFLLGILMLVIYLAFTFPVPYALYFLPFIIVIYFWYYRKLWLIYKSETQAQDIVNSREYFEEKVAKLSGFIRQNRILTFVSVPLLVFVSYYIGLSGNPRTAEFMNFEYLSTHPDLLYKPLIFCAVLTVAAIIGVEILLRIFYLPSLDRVRELLKQLESEE